MKKSNFLAMAMLAGAVYLPQAFAVDYTFTPTATLQTQAFTYVAASGFDYKTTFDFTANTVFAESANSSTSILGGGVNFDSVTLTDLSTATTLGSALHTGTLANAFSLVAGDTYQIEIQGSSVNFDGGGSFSGNLNYVQAVPEPEQIALFLLGLPLVSWLARRKQAA